MMISLLEWLLFVQKIADDHSSFLLVFFFISLFIRCNIAKASNNFAEAFEIF